MCTLEFGNYEPCRWVFIAVWDGYMHHIRCSPTHSNPSSLLTLLPGDLTYMIIVLLLLSKCTNVPHSACFLNILWNGIVFCIPLCLPLTRHNVLWDLFIFLGRAELYCCSLFLFILHGLLLYVSFAIYLPILLLVTLNTSITLNCGSINIFINVCAAHILGYIPKSQIDTLQSLCIFHDKDCFQNEFFNLYTYKQHIKVSVLS